LRVFRVYAASIARFRSARPSKLHSPSIDAPLPAAPLRVRDVTVAGRRARYFREREESEKKHVDACFLVRECSRRRNVGASTWRLEEFVCVRVRMCVFFFSADSGDIILFARATAGTRGRNDFAHEIRIVLVLASRFAPSRFCAFNAHTVTFSVFRTRISDISVSPARQLLISHSRAIYDESDDIGISIDSAKREAARDIWILKGETITCTLAALVSREPPHDGSNSERNNVNRQYSRNEI